jgi:tetratricopeptide (TPR) repeat protein
MSRSCRSRLCAPLFALVVVASPELARAADAVPAPAKPADPEYQTALRHGDQAYLGKRYDEAVKAYQKAVDRQPQKAEAYGRLAAAQREKGDLDGAIDTLGKGLSKRTIDLDAPEEAPAAAAPVAPGEKVYPATARERIKQIEAAEKRFEQYEAVKARIKKREREAESKARGSAK